MRSACASLTAMTGHVSRPSASSARTRSRPVVVSSVPPIRRSRTRARAWCRTHHEVGAVVEGDVRAPARARRHVGGVGLGVLAAARVDLGAEVLGQRRRRLVLRGERVGGAQRHLGAAGDERAHEVGRLGGDVQARRHRDAVERALVGQALADRAQDGHLGVGPFDARPARGRERGVGDVRRAHGHRRPRASASSGSGRACTGPRPARRCRRPARRESSVSLTPRLSRCRRATFSSRCLGST